MQVKHGNPPRSARYEERRSGVKPEARTRLTWMDFYRETKNVALTCRRFGISRPSFYRWYRRYDPMDLTSLESHSHRPHHCRRPTWSFPLESKVLTLRLQFPRWGKDKLAVLLQREGLSVSTSMVGRILAHLKGGGQLREAPRTGVPGSRRALRPRPYAVRKPKQYAVSQPGTWSRSIPWRCARSPAGCSSSLPLAIWSRAGTWCGPRSCHRRLGHRLPGHACPPHAFSHPCLAGRRRFRVRG